MPYLLLALAPLFWSGNWIVGRAMHEGVTPISLNFWRWTVALIILLAIVGPRIPAMWPTVRAQWRRLAILAATGTVVFHSLVYTGLKYTSAINAVLLNSVTPVLVIAVSWMLLREPVSRRQVFGIVVSFAGVLSIVARGDLAALLALQVNSGDLIILLAMPFWAFYSVLLKRWHTGLGEVELVTAIAFFAVLLLAPAYLVENIMGRHMTFDWPTAGAVLYIGLFASVIAYLCWNRGVARVGPNKAGIFLHLLPAYGAVLAVVLLGESVQVFHFVGIALILTGVYLSTSARTPAGAVTTPESGA